MAVLKRPMYASGDPRGPTIGTDVQIAKFGARRYETGLMPPPPPGGDTKHFGSALRDALKTVIQPREGIPATGNIGKATWDVLWDYLDKYRKAKYLAWTPPVIPKPVPVPDLGPLYRDGASVLNHSLTHNTDGIPGYPAYDDGWIAGRTILAVEDFVISRSSSATPGDAFYAVGKSKLQYWYGHLVSAPSVGREFKKGDMVGNIMYQANDKSHIHLGIDARPLIGHSLLYGATGHGPDYTYGSPTVGTQLREALSL